MQKVLSRSALAKRQAERRATKKAAEKAVEKRRTSWRERKQISGLNKTIYRAERAARREDWILGPLAPRRDVGEAAKTYGALPPGLTRGFEKVEWKEHGIVQGDRVAVAIRGHRDEGKIGTVLELSKEREECVVEGLNRADIAVPEYMLVNDPDKTPTRPYPLPVPLSDVKLVAKLPNPETGVERDVVINELKIEKNYGRDRDTIPFKRRIAGVVPRTYIPLPKKEDPEYDDYDSDTLRLDVEESTWMPTLREPPMPASIIDELRNKYGTFRTRHDDWYIAKKEEEDRKARESKEMLKLKMVTPMQELKMKEKAEKQAKAAPRLSDEMLAKIGEIMVRNRQVQSESPKSSTSQDL